MTIFIKAIFDRCPVYCWQQTSDCTLFTLGSRPLMELLNCSLAGLGNPMPTDVEAKFMTLFACKYFHCAFYKLHAPIHLFIAWW